MYGNNIECAKIKRILIPLFTQENANIQPGLKYFFPETPEIDRNNIVGIEANIVAQPTLAPGDISDSLHNIVRQATAKDLYLCIYNNNNEEIFYNLPLRSLFTYSPFGTTPFTKLNKRIHPLIGKIKTRSCFAIWPANVSAPALSKLYISLSFFYN